jgi:hypothetical protein
MTQEVQRTLAQLTSIQEPKKRLNSRTGAARLVDWAAGPTVIAGRKSAAHQTVRRCHLSCARRQAAVLPSGEVGARRDSTGAHAGRADGRRIDYLHSKPRAGDGEVGVWRSSRRKAWPRFRHPGSLGALRREVTPNKRRAWLRRLFVRAPRADAGKAWARRRGPSPL